MLIDVVLIVCLMDLRFRDSPTCFLLFYQRGKTYAAFVFVTLGPSTTLIG